MNKLPIILLCGNAGVGKDETGKIICERLDGWKRFAQADTIKEISKKVFGFTDGQLWGPSEMRNAVDDRFGPKGKGVLYEQLYRAGDGWDDGLAKKFVDEFYVATGAGRNAGTQQRRFLVLTKAFFAALTAFAAKEGGLTPRIVLQLMGTEVGRAYDRDIWVNRALERARVELIEGAAGVVVTDGRFRNEILGFRGAGGYAIKVSGDTTLQGSQHASEAELNKIPPQFYDAILYNNKAHGLPALRYAVGELLDGMIYPRRVATA